MVKHKEKSREILILHNDVDEYLAKSLLSFLSGKVEGFVVSRRNQRWGCDPDQYLNVIQLNGVGSELPLWNKTNIIPVSTTPYHEALKASAIPSMSKRRYADSKAKEIALKLSETL